MASVDRIVIKIKSLNMNNIDEQLKAIKLFQEYIKSLKKDIENPQIIEKLLEIRGRVYG